MFISWIKFHCASLQVTVGRRQQARAKAACKVPRAKAKAKAKSKGKKGRKPAAKAKAKAKAKSRAGRKAVPKAKAKAKVSKGRKGKGNEMDVEERDVHSSAPTDHYSEEEGRPTVPRKRNQKPTAKAESPREEIKTPTPKRHRGTSASGSKPKKTKKTFARRNEPKTDPSKTYWNAIKESFVAEVQEKVKNPSSLEDRFEQSILAISSNQVSFLICAIFSSIPILDSLALFILHVGPLLEVLQ